MPLEDNIPELKQEHRDLLMLLRAAIDGAVAPAAPADWPAVLELARFHQVDMFLYPHVAQWLNEGSLNEIPSATHQSEIGNRKSEIPFQPPPADLLARWRQAYIAAAVKYEQASAQLKEILQALHEAGVPVIPLKGAWLAEKVYDEGAQRPMCDLDLLVPLEQFDRARAVFESIGYTTPDHYFDTARDKDIHYRHPDRPKMIELHFRIWHEVKTNVLVPDSLQLWNKPIQTTMFGIPVYALPPERLIVYVAQHILYSSLTIPTRAYLDLILLNRGTLYDPAQLAAEANALGIPFGAKFLMRLALEFAGTEPAPGMAEFIAETHLFNDKLRDTFRATLELTGASAQLRPELADSQNTSLAGKLRIGLGVVFKPPGFIRSAYPDAVARFGLVGGYRARLQDVAKRSAQARQKARRDDPTLETDLKNFNTRRDVCNWLLSCDKKQKSPVGGPRT